MFDFTSRLGMLARMLSLMMTVMAVWSILNRYACVFLCVLKYVDLMFLKIEGNCNCGWLGLIDLSKCFNFVI